MAKGLRTLAALLGPLIVLAVFYWAVQPMRDILWQFLVLHLLTLVWVVQCFRRRLCRVSVLPLSFLLSVAGPYVIDTMRVQMFQYLGTAFFAILYALPWALVTFVAAIVFLILERKRSV